MNMITLANGIEEKTSHSVNAEKVAKD